jgi:hypothetical protein
MYIEMRGHIIAGIRPFSGLPYLLEVNCHYKNDKNVLSGCVTCTKMFGTIGIVFDGYLSKHLPNECIRIVIRNFNVSQSLGKNSKVIVIMFDIGVD